MIELVYALILGVVVWCLAVLGIKTAAEIMQAAEAKANEILAKQQ